MTRTKTIVPRSARLRLALILLLACAAPQTDEPEDQDVDGAVTSEDEVVTGETRAPDGLSLVYDVRGSGEVALVFVHCWACDRSFWREQLDAFADEYRVVSLDLGGHGDSGREGDEWTIEGLARDVLAVADALAGTGVPIRCINAAPRPPVGPATDVEANRRFADFDAVLMEDVGHYLMIERPAELNRLLGELLDELLGG